jgi:hypothetical protein
VSICAGGELSARPEPDDQEDTVAGLGDMVNKAKEWAGDNPEKADSAVDKGGDALKGKFAGHDEQFDQAGDKAKDYLHGGEPAQGEQPPPPPQGEQPPPPPQ